MDNKYFLFKLVTGETLMALQGISGPINMVLCYPVQIEDKTEDAWDYLMYAEDKLVTIPIDKIVFKQPLSEYATSRYKSIVENIKNREEEPQLLQEFNDYDSLLQ